MHQAGLVRGGEPLGDLQARRRISAVSSRPAPSAASRSSTVRPSMYSMTMASSAPSEIRSWICTTAGWLRRAASWASRRNRSRCSGDSPMLLPDALDGDPPLQLLIPGEEDLAHAAEPEPVLHAVGADPLGRGGRTMAALQAVAGSSPRRRTVAAAS